MNAKTKHMLIGLAAGMVLIKLGRDGLFGEMVSDYVSTATNADIIEGVKY